MRLHSFLKPLAILMVLLGFGHAYACDMDGKTGIVEENDLWISVDDKGISTISKDQFNNVIDIISGIYAPIIQTKGGNLQVNRKWEDGTVNASAQQMGSNWVVNMYGGLARHSTITKDGFALVLCHEIGHHIGGLPKKKMFWMTMWASNEGQADYFGAMKCLRRYMEPDDNIEIVKNMDVPEYATQKCREQFNNDEEIALCQRASMAGLSLGNLFKVLKKLPTALKFSTPDPNRVSKTDHNHPAPQCRLDTYFAGSLCTKDVEDDVSDQDANQGVCSRAHNDITITTRPLCWYAPSDNGGGGDFPFPFPPGEVTAKVQQELNLVVVH